MSRVSSDAGDDADVTKFGDSTESHQINKFPDQDKLGDSTETETETGSPPLKKAKTEVQAKPPVLLKVDSKDPEYQRQIKMFEEQYEKSEGYDVEWDKFCYYLPAFGLEWAGEHGFDDKVTNKEFIEQLIKYAIEVENEETGTNFDFVEYVSATIEGVRGFLFYITFWAKDLSNPEQKPKLYQTKVWKFVDEIFVREFRLRPSQHLR